MAKVAWQFSDQGQLDRVVKRIVDRFHPDMVIVFGSRARAEARPDSDIDLLVVMSVEGTVPEKRLEVRLALPNGPVPVDVIVTTPEDFAWRKGVVGTLEWAASREGIILYGPC